MYPHHVLEACAKECARQHSGEMSVLHLCNAWDYLNTRNERDGEIYVTEGIILILGSIVEPEKNRNGFRSVPVVFRNGNSAIPAENVVRALKNLLENQANISADEFYKEFELIHPFVDGNGRVGFLLWNWMKETLYNPVAPPDMFK